MKFEICNFLGTEVKSCRSNNVQMSDGHIQIIDGEAWAYNIHINEWSGCGGYFQHEAKRPRKLLLHKNEILKLEQKSLQQNFEIIPIRMYFNEKKYIKVEIGVGKKKNLQDKRQDIEGREVSGREQSHLILFA